MKVPIIIDFERTGGYAGLTLRTTVDSHSLSADETEELGHLLDEAGILGRMQESERTEPSPDQFFYTLSIRLGEEQHFVRLAEKQIPLSVRPLLKFLTKRSRIKKENHNP